MFEKIATAKLKRGQEMGSRKWGHDEMGSGLHNCTFNITQ